MGRILRVLAAALAVVAASVALAACGGAAAAPELAASRVVPAGLQDFGFDSLDVDYTLTRADDGTSRMTVVETFDAVFPSSDQNHGMQRSIPDSYNGAPLFPRLVSITDGAGNPRPSETGSDSGTFTMTSRDADFVHGPQTYVFTYTLENVTYSFADTDADEFYWDVNGVEWAQTFGRVTARLHVAPDLADALTGAASCYVGYQGSTQTCDIARDAGPDGGAIVRADAGQVYPYQTVTMAVAFERGTFAPFDASYLASPWGWLQGAAGLGVLAALIAAIIVRVRRLRDEPGRPTIIAEYTPPPGVDALQGAVLLGKDAKAIPAEVLEQAVVGSIRIVEGGHSWFGRVKLVAELLDPSRADGDGRMLLAGLFGMMSPGATFEFGRSDARFSAAAQSILKAAGAELARRGLRRQVAARTRALPVVLAVVAAVLVWVLGFFALGAGVSALIPILLMVVSIPVVFIVGGLVARKPLTAAGAEVRDHLAGLKVFIEWAEADRIRMLQSPSGAERVRVDPSDPRQMLRLYEVLLPFAVVFGQEKAWAQQLAVLYGPDATPYWYAGTSGFNAASFSAGISSLSAVASSSSSTSGGSGGGGSAGGGGGGGGGGGV
ncbi:DUF2207 domain-containing protein [Microbacterium rhizomatis]|uniref:DUF2207 domain-containing protein n=1 Tax=Microbacterium rhizomatis TaxID=1631477 RepID=A0A5J5J696_9MICO|nr:DUF2207 domain-containing protein [Microbacterium rhizomatis]KAA9111551.1 DUF2207 domain-containing protein [Microbacterium rhizomatis]